LTDVQEADILYPSSVSTTTFYIANNNNNNNNNNKVPVLK